MTNGEYTDIIGKVEIGDNCFIGWGSIVLPGVSLANNTIVAAGSVVTKSVDAPGCIIAGNPARIIGNIDDYAKKNIDYCVNLSYKTYEEKVEIIKNHKPLLKRKVLR